MGYFCGTGTPACAFSVNFGEFPLLFRGGELLKLALGLPPRVIAFHKEENVLGAGGATHG
jgi:hypothetical protein